MPRRALVLGLALCLTAGCRSRAAAPASPPAARVEEAASAEPPRRPGFVVYLLDGASARTWVLPYSPGEAPGAGEPSLHDGWWLLTDEEPRQVTVWGRDGDEGEGGAALSKRAAQALWAARCAPGDAAEGACGWPPREVAMRVDAEGRALALRLDDEACRCVALPVADLAVLTSGEYVGLDERHAGADEDEDESREDEDDEWACGDAFSDVSVESVALLGGVLQQYRHYHQMDCGGDHYVDISGDNRELLPGAALPTVELDEHGGSCSFADRDEVPWALPERFELEAAGADGEEEQEPWGFDETVWSVRRGRLVRSQLGASSQESWACHAWTPARPELCPSAADPCGDTARFPGLADVADEFWVASDDSAVLVLGEAATIVRAGGELRVDEATTKPPPGEILGVRQHADLTPLLRVGAKAERGRALPWFPLVLRLPKTSPPPAPPLAAKDRGLVERRGGRDWGNRCFAHFKAGRLEAAEAACAQGLAVATEPAIRAAIFHSLGRIFEERGDSPAALVYYRTSLALRDDVATAERFAGLLRELP